MRNLSFLSVLSFSVLSGSLVGVACSSQDPLTGHQPMSTSELLETTPSASTSSVSNSAATGSGAATVTSTMTTLAPLPATTAPSITFQTDVSPDASNTSDTEGEDDVSPNASQDPNQSEAMPSPTATHSSTSNMSTVECTDNPDPEQTCQQRKEWGNCEQQWMIDGQFCNRTCERCGGGDVTEPWDGNDTTSATSTNDTSAPDSRFPPLNSGGDGHATRYWDCAKPSCGWSNNAMGRPVRSCDRNGNNLGPTEATNGLQGGGTAFTCMSWSPWAKNDSLSFGFVATHTNATCGKCYQLTFTGQGQYDPADPGSVALKNKTMVVMATNIGGDVGGLQFDTLIPGGGVGLNNACGNQGITFSSESSGGLLTECTKGGGASELSSRKECVRQKCNAAFGNDSDMLDGCLWFADWYQAADNPKFWSKEVSCPDELTSIAY